MNINTDVKMRQFIWISQHNVGERGAFIASLDVFTECKKQIIEDRVRKGEIYKYPGSLQQKGINYMEIKEKLKENTEFTCGENIKASHCRQQG